MSTEAKYAAILSSLSNGVDPVTGAVMPAGHFLHNNDVVRALHFGAEMLRSAAEPLANVGKPWTAEMDKRLLFLVERTIQVRSIAEMMGRTPAGINARIEHLRQKAAVRK